jgi:hypothetical protein
MKGNQETVLFQFLAENSMTRKFLVFAILKKLECFEVDEQIMGSPSTQFTIESILLLLRAFYV